MGQTWALVNMVMNINTAGLAEEQYDRMVAEGLADLDKSGIAELTFRGRQQPKG